MATPKPGKGSTVREFTQGTIDRITGKRPSGAPVNGAPTVASEAEQRAAFTPAVQYFPSGMPYRDVAPAGTTTGRAFDFPSFVNTVYTPRGEQGANGIGFATLRCMAEPAEGGLDLLRLAIETRKDQMAAQRWSIRSKKKDGTVDDGGDRARALEAWLARPDGVHTFGQWMRMLLEDHFVIDAPTIYFSPTAKGKPPLLEIVDGATIKRLITGDDGRTPLPPLPAYQQIIKGTPAESYTLNEIGYYVYNVRSNRLYGMSRAEQVVVTVRIALERAMSQLGYYTEGTTPDGFMELPKDFTLEQVQQWTEWFNSELEGQTGQRRKIRFVLQDSKYTATKTEILKDAFDEWLARIICYCFSLSPQALVKEMNRSTAETGKKAAQEEGLEPTKLWFKDVMDDALARAGYADLEWAWEDEEIVDPTIKANVVSTYRGQKGGKSIITIAEARKMIGAPPATPEQLDELEAENVPTPTPFGSDGGDPGGGKDDAPNPPPKKSGTKNLYAKAGRSSGGRSLPPLARNTKLNARTQRAIRRQVRTVLATQHDAVIAAFQAQSEKYLKADDAGVAALVRQILKDGWDDEAREKLWNLLSGLSADRAAAAMAQLEPYIGSGEYATALTQANERAVEWARFRVSNMITEIDDTTHQVVNELTASAIEDGLTNKELADQLSEAFEFSDARAEMIARTETAFADTAGAIEGYAASGVVEAMEWNSDAEACDECAAMNGQVLSLDDDGPPLHPNCECAVAPVIAEGIIVE